jgi:hypothetical protein
MRAEHPKLEAGLAALGIDVRSGTSLSELTSLGIGGTTDLLRITNITTSRTNFLVEVQTCSSAMANSPGLSFNSPNPTRESSSKAILPTWTLLRTSAALSPSARNTIWVVWRV